MKRWFVSINTYLLCGLAVMAVGCASTSQDFEEDAATDPKEKKAKAAAKKKQTKEQKNTYAVMRFHQQVASAGDEKSANIQVFRARPVDMIVSKSPFMDETFVEKSEVIDEGGGAFMLKVQLNQRGSMLLESMTAMNLNSHIAIWTAFGVMGSETNETRWLAAPFVRRRIADGTITFTPDATREETERIALGLNNAADMVRRASLLRPQ